RGVSFTGGGEPMLHKDFTSIIVHARQVGLDVGLITNGSAITARNVDVLVDNLSWVRVSMAGGDPESYKAVQGVDHFDRVIANIGLLTKARNARN
ncbi:radical SAM protein, partial [Enterococcus faecalis]|uniref:radical SAM protein n=1 Tax=Enterococcus faecalis TaxID=1351 RepID=UPI00403F764B